MALPYKLTPYWIGLVLFVTAWGFWPSFFSNPGSAPLAFHVHGITATAWIILVGFQSWSIHQGKRKWHRWIGIFSLILFPLLAAGFVMILNVSAKGYLDVEDPFYNQLGPSFAWGVTVPFIAYLWFFFQGMRHRRNVNLHAAYMLSTLFFVWEAPVSRLILRYIPSMSVGGPDEFYKISYAIVMGITMAMLFAILLFILDPQHRKPFIMAAAFMAIQIGGFLYLPARHSRSSLFNAYAQLSPGITICIGLVLGSLSSWIGWRYPVRRSRTRTRPK